MDDDLDFGASVWGAPERISLSVSPPTFSEPSPAPSSSQDGFEDFDDFGTPAETIAASGDEADDDFGDFGDFGEVAQVEGVSGFEGEEFEQPIPTPRPPTDWQPLRLDASSSRDDLQRQIDMILGPLWPADNSSHFTDDPIRQVEGLNQLLVTRERYFLLPPSQGLYLKSQVVLVVNYMIYCYRLLSQVSSQSTGQDRAYDVNISLLSVSL